MPAATSRTTAATTAATPAAAKRKPAPAAKPAAKPAAAKSNGKAVKADVPVVVEAPVKVKQKLVRDSFTLPQADFDLIGQLKARAIAFGRPAKKSELLRAGLQALSALNDARLRAALETLVPLKPGRPKKGS